MIYSRFGTKLTLVSKTQAPNGLLSIQAVADEVSEPRDYHTGDLTADNGFIEINEMVELLPWKATPKAMPRRSRRPQ
jgi:hypothetical protein